WVRALRSQPPWFHSCWPRSCSRTSDCSVERGSKGVTTNERARGGGRHARNALPGVGVAPVLHAVAAAQRVSVRAAVSVLLDGDHDVQAERGVAVARGQPVLGS